MATETKKLTDADLMTGFNPAFGVTAEEIEAQQDGEVVETASPEGEATEKEEGDGSAPPADSGDVEVRLDGKAVRTSKEVADAFTREINRRDGTRGAELQQLRERLAHLEGARSATTTASGPTKEPEPQVPDPELQIENPAEYQKQLVAYITHQQEKRTEALATQYEQDQAAKEQESARRSAWSNHVDTFYNRPENAVLRENKDIVDLVMAQHREDLAPLSVEDGFKELGRLAKERLSKLTGSAPELKARNTPKPPILEGSARRGTPARPAAESDGPRSLTEALKERRKAAAASFGKGGSGRPGAPAR
jgi:hypothetical protein